MKEREEYSEFSIPSEALCINLVKFVSSKLYIGTREILCSIDPKMWEYQIGGYPVIEKWLKDRKGQTIYLTKEENIVIFN